MQKKHHVLLALMGLGIGGAETHAVELAKGLAQNGFYVVVVSNGGVYEKELEALHIKHYFAPLDKKNPFSVMRSLSVISSIIKQEQIELVHAHARIPATLCFLLRRFYKFHFITTAHGIRTKFFGTTWGEKTLAVSEDIKEHLVRDFRVKPKNITVTVNGIDMDKFSEKTDGAYILEEFFLVPSCKRILHVSRLDNDRKDIVLHILEACRHVFEKDDQVQLLLVGDGSAFHEIEKAVQGINQSTGRSAVILTGQRTDINAILAVSHVFIGSERASLEAMAVGVPVVLAAKSGYMGLFTEDNKDEAMKVNFTCRGKQKAKPEIMAQDILKALSLPEDKKRQLSFFLREFIRENYSVKKMVADNIFVYSGLLERTNLLISGYYGFNNLGDESILMAMYNNIRLMDANINLTVLSNQPEDTRKKYHVSSIYRFSFLNVLKEIWKTDILVSGGGSLLQDRTSTRSLLYYTSIIATAKMMRKKVMLYANGIGPVTKRFNRRIVKTIVNQADLITLREQDSFDELRNMGISNQHIYVTADPVFTVKQQSPSKAQELLGKAGVPSGKPVVGISVRSWTGVAKFTEEFAKLCDYIVDRHQASIVFIVMQIPHDISTSNAIREKMKNPSYILQENLTPHEIMDMMTQMEMCLSMRLHTLIFAARVKIPMLGFVYDPKIDYYLKLLQMPSAGRVQEFNADDMKSQVDDILQNRQAYIDTLSPIVDQLEDKAKLNEYYLSQLIGDHK